MLKSTILAILAATISSASAAPAVTEPTAVEYATTSKESCSTNQKDYVISDGGCFRLPGKWLAVYRIARTCRGKLEKINFASHLGWPLGIG